jgi:hypothetical protein
MPVSLDESVMLSRLRAAVHLGPDVFAEAFGAFASRGESYPNPVPAACLIAIGYYLDSGAYEAALRSVDDLDRTFGTAVPGGGPRTDYYLNLRRAQIFQRQRSPYYQALREQVVATIAPGSRPADLALDDVATDRLLAALGLSRQLTSSVQAGTAPGAQGVQGKPADSTNKKESGSRSSREAIDELLKGIRQGREAAMMRGRPDL